MAPLHPVPLDKDTPFPVSPQRIYGCLEQMDLLVETIASDAVAGVVLDGLPFVVYLDADSRYLSIRCTWDTHEPYRQVLDCLSRSLTHGTANATSPRSTLLPPPTTLPKLLLTSLPQSERDSLTNSLPPASTSVSLPELTPCSTCKTPPTRC